MANKQAALSIVIRTVDQTTAKLNAITKRIETLNKPYKDLGEAFGKLADKSGFNAVVDGFKGVGSAVGEVIGRVALIGGAVALATVEVFKMVGEFATLGHNAKRAGVEADFLAGMRFAAEKSGVSVEALDESIMTLTQNLGQASAGTGRMLKFLTAATGPVFTKQIVSAHNTQEAMGLLFDAIQKLPDASRRAALAQKTFGDSSIALIAAKGSKGVMELMGAYARLAGSQQAAVESSLKVEESMVDLKAVTTGVKAAIVTGLAPALKLIVDKLTVWFVAHRADVELWAKQIGDELPGAVDKVIAAVKGAIKWVTDFVDDIGGLKVAAVIVAGVIAGPLISAVASLSLALATTPFGAFIVSLGAMAAALGVVVDAFKETNEQAAANKKEMFDDWGLWKPGGGSPLGETLQGKIDEVNRASANLSFIQGMQQPPAFAPFAPPAPAPRIPAGAFGSPSSSVNATNVNVTFENAPKGMRATADPRGTASVDLTVGHNLFGAP
jgi:hypothetical protein